MRKRSTALLAELVVGWVLKLTLGANQHITNSFEALWHVIGYILQVATICCSCPQLLSSYAFNLVIATNLKIR